MSAYDKLKNNLLSRGEQTIKLSFQDIQVIIEKDLPKSAFTYKEWWANGGHSHARAWIEAGYMVDVVDLLSESVTFVSGQCSLKNKAKKSNEKHVKKAGKEHNVVPVISFDQKHTINVCGYEFGFLQQLMPERDENNQIVKFYPQDDYDNKNNLELSITGVGAFCRFSLEVGEWQGVYLWMIDEEIIYIGETANLRQRFNSGYGKISPRNCYVGGQTTNCKMNKVVLDYYEQGEVIDIYFLHTENYKGVELELLRCINTKYNVKDNIH